MRFELLAVVASAALALPALAQTPAPAALNVEATPANPVPGSASSASHGVASSPSACCRVAAGATVDVELAELVSTKKQKRGDHFALRLAESLVIDGSTVIPAGAAGSGEVVDAASGGIGGRPAKLVLAARYIDYGGRRLLLHGFRLGGGGHDNSKLATVLSATPYIGLLAIAIPGGDVEYPAGTRAAAKVTAEVFFPVSPAPHSPSQTPPSPPQGSKP